VLIALSRVGLPVFTSSWITGPAPAPPFPLVAANVELTKLFVVNKDNPIVAAINMSSTELGILMIFTTIPVMLIGFENP